MLLANSLPALCSHCGYGHTGLCPRVKAIEYHQDGTVRRVEYHGDDVMKAAGAAIEGYRKPLSDELDRNALHRHLKDAAEDGLIAAQIVEVLPAIHETSTLLGDEDIPLEEWKRCLVNANQRIAELEAAMTDATTTETMVAEAGEECAMQRVAELETALRMLEVSAVQIEETMVVPRLDWAMAFQKAWQ